MEEIKKRKKIGEILIDAGLITEAQLGQGLQDQQTYGGRLGTILLERCFITEKEYLLALTSQLGVPAVDFKRVVIPGSVIKMIPQDMAWESMVLPVFIKEKDDRKILVLAMADPTDANAIKAVKEHTKHEVEPALALENTIRYVLMDYYQSHYGHGDYKIEGDPEIGHCAGRDEPDNSFSGQRTQDPEPPRMFIGEPSADGDTTSEEESRKEEILFQDKLSKEHSMFTLELKAFLTLLIRKGLVTTEEYLDVLRELRREEYDREQARGGNGSGRAAAGWGD